MKFATLALMAVGAKAFAPSAFGVRSFTSLMSTRIDATEAIMAATAASKTYGPTSPEARVAWDIVEEIDASDNSASFTGGINEEDCLVPENDEPPECKDYEAKLEELTSIMDDFTPRVEKMKALTEEIQALKIPVVKGQSGKDSPQLRAAMANAKEMTEKHGATSPEAKVAWAEVEEIGSGGYTEALGGMITDECLVEMIDTCEALDELNRVVQLNKEKDGSYGG